MKIRPSIIRSWHLLLWSVLLTGVSACSNSTTSPAWLLTVLNDEDGDGWVDCAVLSNDTLRCDCNDLDPDINPDQKDDTCNSADEDCSGEDDQDAVFITWYPDADGDGYALDAAPGTDTCSGPPTDGKRYATQLGDCDDSSPERSPILEERCDGIDNDCDGQSDDGLALLTAYLDEDGDGYGRSEDEVNDCLERIPPEYVYLSEDCDDAADDIYPGAKEVCNEIDDDCDDLIDLDDGLYSYRMYPDEDKDTYLDRSKPFITCDAEVFVAQQSLPPSSDCNDQDSLIHPGRLEEDECNGETDLNCDGTLPTDDLDGDGFTLCTEQKDCDLDDAGTYPGAPEQCDGKDNDCNKVIDDLTTELVLYLDHDQDGYGVEDASPLILKGCQAVDTSSSYVLVKGDCDDNDDSRSPGASEACNGIDDDCDDTIDEGLPQQSWYPDEDGDGFGRPEESQTLQACAAPTDYAAYSGDCDDEDPAIHPYAIESCTSTEDLNCDGKVEASADTDQDGISPCNGDCNDNDSAVYPSALETCNGIDDNCDLYVDNKGSEPWYKDWDMDGYAPSDSKTYLLGCNNPGWTQTLKSPFDCDDKDINRSPGTSESCDGKDNDCDKQIDEDLTCLLLSAQEVSP